MNGHQSTDSDQDGHLHEAVRQATTADISVVTVLARHLRDELLPFRGADWWAELDAMGEPLAVSLAATLMLPDHALFVGTIDDVVVGYGVARVDRLHARGEVVELYVEPGAREIGLGASLADAIVDWCRVRGCRGVDARALPGHREMKNFLEAHHFVSRQIVMHHVIAETPAATM